MAKEFDIVIIGGGISGLSTAFHLKKYAPELSVVILEGRNRLGGRIHSLDFANGKFDIGATFIHSADEKNPIFNLANELGIEIHHFDWDKSKYCGEFATDPSLFDKIYKIYDEEIYEKESRIKFLEEKEQKEDVALSIIFDRLKQKLNLSDQEIAIFDAITVFEIHSNYAEQIERLSALNWNQDSEFEVNRHFVFNSNNSYYQLIADHLAKDQLIYFNTIVNEIIWDSDHDQNLNPDHIINNNNLINNINNNNINNNNLNNKINEDKKSKIICENGEIFYAKKGVVCTVPLSILKSKKIKFSPELPKEKIQSISKLGISLLNLILLEFEEEFWGEENNHVIFNLSPKYEQKIYFFCNLKNATKRNILRCYVGSDFARELEKLSDEMIINIVLENLIKLFGKISKLNHFYITRWGLDPFSLGSYSHLPTGASGEDYEEMGREVENKLFFAGEATIRSSPATIHGAFSSGLREANKISSLFSPLS